MATGSSAKTAQKKSGDTVKKPVFNDHLFLGGIEGILRANEMMQQGEDRDDSAAYWDALGTWGATLDNPYQEEFESAVDAINSFEAWLVLSNWHYAAPILYTAKGFTVTMTMNAPSGQISVSLDGEVSPGIELADAIKEAKKDLQQAISAAFPRTANKPDTNSKNGKSGAKKSTTKTEEVSYELLRVVEFNGKLMPRLIPTEGKWIQFGIPLYQDIADKFEIEIPDEPGDYEMSGTMIYELKEDGKPKRVTEISPD